MTDHIHDWQPYGAGDYPWECISCDDISAACSICKQPTGGSLLACEPCLQHERAVLQGIGRLLEQWDERDRNPRSSMRFSAVKVSGSSSGGGGGLRDADDVEEALLGWAGRWAEHMPNSGQWHLDYLAGHLVWAVHNQQASNFEEYRESIRGIRTATRRVVGLASERLVDRCGHCGGRVYQDRADRADRPYRDGLQEEVRCGGCGTTWSSPEEFQLSVKVRILALPIHNPEAWVTLDQAAAILPDVPRETLRTWVKRDRAAHERSVVECDAWDDRWTAWEESGQVGPIPAPPEFVDREISEREDGRLRLGDLARLAERRVATGRRGSPAVAVS